MAPSRKRVPRETKRSEIKHAAKQIIHRKGYESASLQDIADALNMKKASLYYYFDSKEGLLREILAEIVGEGMERVRAVLACSDDPLTRLWRLVAGHIDHLCRNTVDVAVFLHERKAIPLDTRKTALSDDYAYQAAFIDTIRAGQQSGQVRPEIDARLAALSLIGSINWIYTWFRPGGEMEPAFIGSQFATMSINSLATEAAQKNWRAPTGTASRPIQG